MKKKAKYRLIKLVSAMSLLVVIIVSISLAWFYTGETTNVYDIDIHIERANDLFVATEDLTWTTLLTDSEDDSSIFKCISGNGSSFYYPNYQINYELETSDKFVPIYNDISSYSLINENNLADYLYVKDVYFKTSNEVKLFLTNQTQILPKDITKRLIPNINVSKDYMAGALRFGFAVKENDEFVTKFIWIPNSTYELTLTGNVYGISTEGNVEDEYTFVNGTSLTDLITIQTEGEETGQITIDDVLYAWGDIAENTYICNMLPGITEVRMSIWLEGSDREAEPVLSGGFIEATIDFDSEMVEVENN